MSQEKEHAFSSDFMFYVVKQNSEFQTERDEALKKVAELEKKLAGQQADQQQQQPQINPDNPAIAQAKALGWNTNMVAGDLFDSTFSIPPPEGGKFDL